MIDILRPYLSRIIAAWVAALSGWLTAKIGVSLDPETQVAAVNLGLGIALTLYGIVHKLISSKLNPLDAASVESATRTKAKHESGQL